jgi:hemoglobin
MFSVWLGLFDSVLKLELPADTATEWSALAHRIGRGLMFGMQGAEGAPPSLR